MYKLLIVTESLNKNKSSEGIATVNFLNAIDTDLFEVYCVNYEYPQFQVEIIDWINPKINLIQVKNNRIDYFFSKLKKVKNFFSRYLGISILKEYRVFRLKKILESKFGNYSFDLIFSRTVATSICSHRALVDSTLINHNNVLIYFNDPVPFSLMPAPYSNGVSFNPKFDRREIDHVKNIISKVPIIASPSKLLNDFFVQLHGDYTKPTFTFPHLYMGYDSYMEIDCSDYIDSSKINISHCGSLFAERDPSTLVLAVGKFLEVNPQYKGKVAVNFLGPIHPGHVSFFESTGFDFINVVNKRISHAISLALMYQSHLPVLIEASADESPFMPVKLAEMIGLGRIFLALSPKKSETRRILGNDYSFQTEVMNMEEMVSIIDLVVKEEFDREKELGYIADLQCYVSPKTVNSSLKQLIQN